MTTDATIAVTGATGHLGRLAVDALLRRGVPAERIIGIGRNEERLAELARLGVAARRADYEDPEAVRAALAGADRLLFISGSEVGRRVTQHRNVITAARDAGVGLVAYTSIANADRTGIRLADEHKATERELAASGLPHVRLRHSWYIEVYTDRLPTILEHGLVGCAGDGRVSAAARADYAEAAAAVMTTDGHEGAVYELGGTPFSMAELAAEISRQAGGQVTYTDVPPETYTKILVDAGLPEPYAASLADADLGLARGDLLVAGNDLERLMGRPPTPLADVIRAALPA